MFVLPCTVRINKLSHVHYFSLYIVLLTHQFPNCKVIYMPLLANIVTINCYNWDVKHCVTESSALLYNGANTNNISELTVCLFYTNLL